MTAETAVPATPSSMPTKPIPRRRGHWFWGCLMEMIQNRSGFLVEVHEEHGDVFVSRALLRDLLFVRDPAVVYGINVTHWADFHKPDYIKQMWKQFLGNGLVPNDGESWKRHLATLVRRLEITIPDGFEPDFVTKLSMHPGDRGMPTDVKFLHRP